MEKPRVVVPGVVVLLAWQGGHWQWNVVRGLCIGWVQELVDGVEEAGDGAAEVGCEELGNSL